MVVHPEIVRRGVSTSKAFPHWTGPTKDICVNSRLAMRFVGSTMYGVNPPSKGPTYDPGLLILVYFSAAPITVNCSVGRDSSAT
jgi:hypothetical protein